MMSCADAIANALQNHVRANHAGRSVNSARKKKPGNQRGCIYAIKGIVSWRICTRNCKCASCEFAQMMEDRVEPSRIQALSRKEWERKATDNELRRVLVEQRGEGVSEMEAAPPLLSGRAV